MVMYKKVLWRIKLEIEETGDKFLVDSEYEIDAYLEDSWSKTSASILNGTSIDDTIALAREQDGDSNVSKDNVIKAVEGYVSSENIDINLEEITVSISKILEYLHE